MNYLRNGLFSKFIIKNIKNFCTKQEKTIDVNGQTINYLKTGNGDKPVLCFPGALGTIWSDFKPQIEGLDKDKLTIVAWDPPGYGKSRPPERNFSIKFYENDADTAYNLMMKLKIKKFSLLGWSDGGISSMILSAKYPEIVDSLVIWGSNSYILPEEVEAYETIRDIKNWSDKMRTPLINLYTEEGLQNLMNGWCNAVIDIYKNGGDICVSSLHNIKCPTFILHGDKDPMIAAEHPDHLLENIKQSKLHRFPEGKHNIHLRYSKEFNELVQNFILS